MEKQFSPECLEQLKSYVYALEDPRVKSTDLKRIFYIGKGTGNRCFAHAKAEIKATDISEQQLKLHAIRKMRSEGIAPIIRIVAHGLKTESEALRIESVLISLLEPLGNLVSGHRQEDNWVSASELDARYKRPLHQNALEASVLLVSLNGGERLSPYPEIENNPDELATRTLGVWTVSRQNASHIDYVIGVYRGLTRCVYRVDKSREGLANFEVIEPKTSDKRRRIRFHGSLDKEHSDWLLRSIVDATGKTMTKFGPQMSWRLLAA